MDETRTKLTETQLIGLANMAGALDDPGLEWMADIARTGRRHNGILPGEAVGYCQRAISRHGIRWQHGRGWVLPEARS